MINNISFAGKVGLPPAAVKNLELGSKHKYFSDRMVEGAENTVKKVEEKLTANINEAYQAAHVPYTVHTESRLQELEKLNKVYNSAYGK